MAAIGSTAPGVTLDQKVDEASREPQASDRAAELGGELAEHGGDRKTDQYQGSGATLIEGRDATYLVSRLKRDEPELAENLHTITSAPIPGGLKTRL